MTRRYVQELDAYFEIEAGDLNGDGLDDLAVYTGRYRDADGRRYALVDVFYATGSGTWQETPSQEIAVAAGYTGSYSKIDYNSDNNWKEEIVKHPVVTIAMGDIDRNLKDELAVVSSAPANNNDADSVAHFSLLACEEDGGLSPVGGMDNVALNDGAGSGMISAGCAFGEFATIDNESVSATTLIIGGWSAGSSVITENKAFAGYSQGVYYYVYYDYATGQYIQSGYRAQSLGGHTTSISQVFNLEGQENGGNGVRVYPTLAPMAVACGDLDGAKVQSVSDQVLFGTQVMDFSLETGFGSELFAFDFCMTQVDDNNNKDKAQPWIGDVVVGTVDSDPGSKNWRETFLFVTGVHRKSEINTSDDYYYMDLGAVWRNENASEDNAKAGYHVLFEGIMAKSNARNDQYGTFVNLALPDVGNDSVIMKFVEKGIVYTDPEVFAVLQASPYFSDLEEVYGYIGNGGTSYGESSGSSTTGGASASASFGAYASAKVELGPAVEFEHSLVATASYDYGYSSDKETAISYNNQAGSGDKVVVYTIPNVLYLYDVYTPGENGTGTWEQVVLTTPLQAVVTMLDVDAYDEVAASTAGLEPIRGSAETGHDILVTPSDNGSLKTDPANAQEGTSVTVTAEPEAGYELISVTVTDGDGQLVDVTEQEDGSCIFVMPAGEVTVEGFFALINPADCQRNEACPLYAYKDADVNAWYHDALHYCVDRGLINGMGGGVLAPDGTTSRAMLVTMLYRLEDETQITGDNGFADVPADCWYSRAVAWAAANGIVKGYGDKTFGSEDAVTREQVVSILYRYAAYKGYDLDSRGTLNGFRDGDQVSGWAAEAMLWALAKGVVNGKGNGILDPTGEAARAEIAQIFMNCF